MDDDNTATKQHQILHPHQRHHQMASSGRWGGFEVVRAASKAENHDICDLGIGGGGGV